METCYVYILKSDFIFCFHRAMAPRGRPKGVKKCTEYITEQSKRTRLRRGRGKGLQNKVIEYTQMTGDDAFLIIKDEHGNVTVVASKMFRDLFEAGHLCPDHINNKPIVYIDPVQGANQPEPVDTHLSIEPLAEAQNENQQESADTHLSIEPLAEGQPANQPEPADTHLIDSLAEAQPANQTEPADTHLSIEPLAEGQPANQPETADTHRIDSLAEAKPANQPEPADTHLIDPLAEAQPANQPEPAGSQPIQPQAKAHGIEPYPIPQPVALTAAGNSARKRGRKGAAPQWRRQHQHFGGTNGGQDIFQEEQDPQNAIDFEHFWGPRPSKSNRF